jgi:hypothetical protein
LASAPAPVKARLITVLGHRLATGALDELLRQAGSQEPTVSRAAFEAIAAVATPRDLPRVIQAATQCRDGDVRELAERAVYTTCLKLPAAAERSAPVVQAFRSAQESQAKSSLLQVLALLGDSAAQSQVSSAYDSPDPQVSDTALRLLAHWPEAGPAPKLLEIFRATTNEVHRTLALRGVVRLATLWADPATRPAGGNAQPPPEAVEWLKQAKAAIRDQVEEKRILLSGLGDLSSAEGLQLLEPYLDDSTVQRDAALALIRAAKGLKSRPDQLLARPMLEKIAAGTTDP